MSVLLLPPSLYNFTDVNGDPLAGGKVYTYAAGTTTPLATYTDSTGTIAAPNPIQLDAAGRPQSGSGAIWGEGAYKFIVKDANDVQVYDPLDNVTSFTTLAGAANAYMQSFSGNGVQTVFTTSDNLGDEEKGLMVFVDNGSPNIATNGTFATDTDWTKGAGWTIAAGVATATGAISTAISQTASVTLVEGLAYSVTYTITASAGSLTASIGGQSGTARTVSGTYREVIIAGSSQTIAFTGAGFTGTLDTVVISLANSKGYEILNPSAYTINGTSLTFASAPKTGVNNIYVFAPSLLLGAASSAAALAQTYATNALASQVAAAASAATATTQAGIATTQASSATSSASTATTQAGLATTNGAAQVALATTQANNASASAATATTQAGIATTQANNAAASAVLAGSTFTATSTTSNSISVASKSFTTQANKNFQAGQFMTVVDSASNANYMFGRVTSYDNGTGALVFDSQAIGGSGTKTSWNISISATTLSPSVGGFGVGAYLTNAYYVGFLNNIQTSSTALLVANTLYANAFIVTESTTFTRIGIQVTTLSTGSARLGIYNFANGAPTTLVLDCGTVAVTSTGEKEITISQSLSAGAYALVMVCDGTPTIRRGSCGTPESIYGYTNGSGNSYTHITQAFTYGALNATFGAATYSTSFATTPSIWLRKV